MHSPENSYYERGLEAFIREKYNDVRRILSTGHISLTSHGEYEDVDDITQQTMLKLWEFRGEIKNWDDAYLVRRAVTIGRNIITDRIRYLQARKRGGERYNTDVDDSIDPTDLLVDDPSRSPEVRLITVNKIALAYLNGPVAYARFLESGLPIDDFLEIICEQTIRAMDTGLDETTTSSKSDA